MFQKVRVDIDPQATPNNCYNNCGTKVCRDGGEVVVGWRKTPATTQGGLIVSLDHHAVWQSPSGELIDITPRVILTGGHELTVTDKEIEFCPAPEATFFEGGRARPSQCVPEAEDKWGLLKRACDWANNSAEHKAAGRGEKAQYADDKAKALLNQHWNRLR
jgi:hypothetical protein